MRGLIALTTAFVISATMAASAVEFTEINPRPLQDGFAYVIDYECERKPEANVTTRLWRALANLQASYVAFSIHDRQRLADIAASNTSLDSLFSEIVILRQNTNSISNTLINDCKGYFFLPSNKNYYISAIESRTRLNTEKIGSLINTTFDAVNPLHFFIQGIAPDFSQKYLDQAKAAITGAIEILRAATPDSSKTTTYPISQGRYVLDSDAITVNFNVRRLDSGFIGDTRGTFFSRDYFDLIGTAGTSGLLNNDGNLIGNCRKKRQEFLNAGFNSIHDRTYMMYAQMIKSEANIKQIYDCLSDNQAVRASYLTFRSSPYQRRFVSSNILTDEQIARFDAERERAQSRWPDDEARRKALNFDRSFRIRRGSSDLARAIAFGAATSDGFAARVADLTEIFTDPIEIIDSTSRFLVMGSSAENTISLTELVERLHSGPLRTLSCYRATPDVALLSPEVDETHYMFVMESPDGSQPKHEVTVRVNVDDMSKGAVLHFSNNWLSQLRRAC